MDNLDTWKKLVSTHRTFSISIALNCRDHQGYILVSSKNILFIIQKRVLEVKN